MVITNRRRLRQRLGLDRLGDTYIGVNTASLAANTASAHLLDTTQANLAFSGEALYDRAWLRHNGMTLRVASFNTGSGAYQTLQTNATTVLSGSQFELSEKLSPEDKDRILDLAIARVWRREEFPIPTHDGLLHYSIPDEVGSVFGFYYFATPHGSLSRTRKELPLGTGLVQTGSGRELRLPQGTNGLAGSQQIILDCQIHATLGSSDDATVNLPDEDWVLDGAASWAYERLARNVPGKESVAYRTEATRFGRKWTSGLSKFRPQVDRPIRFDMVS